MPQHVNRVETSSITVRLKDDAYHIYRQYCPKGPKLGGAFLSQLLFDYQARREERQRLAAAQCRVCGEGGTP